MKLENYVSRAPTVGLAGIYQTEQSLQCEREINGDRQTKQTSHLSNEIRANQRFSFFSNALVGFCFENAFVVKHKT